ncbi:MAG: hypothetical protein F7B20_04080 [Aeropyrum sp.]|nr:hypothetical protein [Aeropyrum sp.]MCE4616466.1 hypothetical protein [Aeropyrum sp.]
MALSDLVRAYELLKELAFKGGVDISYYLVIAGISLLAVTGTFIVGLVVYRILNTAVNTDTAGLLKLTFLLAAFLLAVGVLIP